jgi:hypothetical protein
MDINQDCTKSKLYEICNLYQKEYDDMMRKKNKRKLIRFTENENITILEFLKNINYTESYFNKLLKSNLDKTKNNVTIN